jgi:hypothetical protein
MKMQDDIHSKIIENGAEEESESGGKGRTTEFNSHEQKCNDKIDENIGKI